MKTHRFVAGQLREWLRRIACHDQRPILVSPAKEKILKSHFYLATVSFGASEATIFLKRGTPRKGSHIGSKRNSPYFGPPGILVMASSTRAPVQFCPPGHKLWQTRCCKSLIFTPPDHCFLGGGHQFHRAPAFAQCLLFFSQECIDLPETKK